jgi:hypothetical protein
MTCKCPSSMCPLIAAKGSPWTGAYNADCPEKDPKPIPKEEGDLIAATYIDDHSQGCPWWGMACQGVNGIQFQVEEAWQIWQQEVQDNSLIPVAAKSGPSDNEIELVFFEPKIFDCPRAKECSWQKQAKDRLCPPRDALSRGLNPKVCCF